MAERDTHTEQLFSAYLDDELTRDERARVEQLLQHDPSSREMLESLAAIRADLRGLPRWRLDADFASRVLAVAAHGRQEADAEQGLPKKQIPVRVTTYVKWRTWGYLAIGLGASLLLILFLRPGGLWQLQDQVAVKSESENEKPVGSATTATESIARMPQVAVDQVPAAGANGSDAPSETGNGSVRPASPATPRSDWSGEQASNAAAQPGDAHAQPGHTASVDKPSNAADQRPVQGAPGLRSRRADSTASVPKPPSTDQLLLVMDVFLTPEGREQATFDQTLVQKGLPFFASISVHEKLQQALLASRFFKARGKQDTQPGTESSPTPAAKPPSLVQLVYVVARAGQMDELWRTLQDDKEHVQGVSMDLAFRPAELNMFRQLRDAAETALATKPVANTQTPARRIRNGSYRLILPPTWRGQPARIAVDSAGTNAQTDAGHSSGMGFGSGRLGENLVVEILFVLHSADAGSRD